MGAPVDLDEQIRRVRGLVATSSGPETVGPLVILLLARGNLAMQADRDEDAGADYRAAAGLLASYDDGELPVPVPTARMVWASWTSRARHEGLLDEALVAARRAVALRHDLPVDDLQPYAGFYMDLKNLTADLEKAGRIDDRAEAARLAFDWSRSLFAAAERYEPTIGITGTTLVQALVAAGRQGEAIAVAGETLPVLRRHDLDAILVSLLMGLGTALRQAGRWDEAVETEREALGAVRARTSRMALVEVHVLRMLARSLAGAGRYDDARTALNEAQEVVDAPGRGVVPLREEQAARIRAEIRAELVSLDS